MEKKKTYLKERRLIRKYIKEMLVEGDEYDVFFKATAKKFGYDPEKIDTLSDEKKKEFYNYLDKNWKSDSEKK